MGPARRNSRTGGGGGEIEAKGLRIKWFPIGPIAGRGSEGLGQLGALNIVLSFVALAVAYAGSRTLVPSGILFAVVLVLSLAFIVVLAWVARWLRRPPATTKK